MNYTCGLHMIHSRRDFYGNVYWGFRFTDFATGRKVEACISGGESNMRGIGRHWNVPDDWDRSIYYTIEELKIRDFNRLVRHWPYAGCTSEELAQYIRRELERTV